MRRLSDQRRDRRTRPLGRRQAPADDDLQVVCRRLGQAPQLERGGPRLPHQLGTGVPLGGDGRGVEPCPRGSHGIRAIGIDEIHWQHNANFLTLVYQIEPTRKRLLWIGQHRRAKTLLRFFRCFGNERTAALTFICSDMWKPYLKVVAKKAGHALHILDRFHICQDLSDAIDQVRRAEVRSLRQRGRQPLLATARRVLLKRREHHTREQRARLRDLVQHNLRAVRAMLLRESV